MEKNQNDFFAKILLLLSNLEHDEWIDGLEVQRLLHITRRTVSRLVLNGTLEPLRIGGRNYFSKNSIFNLRNRFKK